jgi:hypothetical protein
VVKKIIKAFFSSTKSGSFHAMLEVILITVTASGLYTRQVQRKEILDSLTAWLSYTEEIYVTLFIHGKCIEVICLWLWTRENGVVFYVRNQNIIPNTQYQRH